MTKLFRFFISLFACVVLTSLIRFNTDAAVLTNVVIESDGTEVRKIKYSTREDVSKFVGLLSFIYWSFKSDFYDICRKLCKPVPKDVAYEEIWNMLWSRYMFQKGQSEQELQRAKFLAHLILSNCVKDRYMRVYWPTLKTSISGIVKSVSDSRSFTIEARKPKHKMWQGWEITAT